MKTILRTSLAAVACMLVAASADAAPIIELEANGTATNNTLATAQALDGAAFTLPVPPTVFNPPGYPTATVTGAGGGSDVDFFSFMATGGSVYFDIDNPVFTFDTILSLFDSGGTLIAFDDDSFPEDSGSNVGFDSFLGVFALPGPGTYYLAVTQFPNFPTALITTDNCAFTDLTRPDGEFGGLATTDCPTDSSFFANGPQPVDSLGYTLHLSVENPAGTMTPIPEPASMLLLGTGLAGVGLRRWRQRRTH